MDQTKKLSNAELVELMKAYIKGDNSAFEKIYLQFESKIFSYITARLYKREWSEEVFQNFFIKFHELRGQYKSEFKLEQWIYVMLRTSIIDFYRKEMKMNKVQFADYLVDHVELEVLREEKEWLDLLESDVEQKVIDLRIFKDQEYFEIAKVLETTEGNVRQIFSRGIKKLKKVLGPSLKEGV